MIGWYVTSGLYVLSAIALGLLAPDFSRSRLANYAALTFWPFVFVASIVIAFFRAHQKRRAGK